MRQLFIDLDGVLADLELHYKAVFGIQLDKTHLDPDFWDNVLKNGTFFQDLPPFHGAKAFWYLCHAFHPDPIILTGLPKSIPTCAEQKRAWVAAHISPAAKMILCPSEEKCHHMKAGDVLVDDWARYQHLWENAGGVFVLHTDFASSIAALHKLFPHTVI